MINMHMRKIRRSTSIKKLEMKSIPLIKLNKPDVRYTHYSTQRLFPTFKHNELYYISDGSPCNFPMIITLNCTHSVAPPPVSSVSAISREKRKWFLCPSTSRSQKSKFKSTIADHDLRSVNRQNKQL